MLSNIPATLEAHFGVPGCGAVPMARQGVAMVTMAEQAVLDPATGRPVPADGELALRGNTVMKGYRKNPQATEETLRDGF